MPTQRIDTQNTLSERLEAGGGRDALARDIVQLGAAHAVAIADLGRDPTSGVVARSLVVQAAEPPTASALLARIARGPLPDFTRPDPRALQAPVAPGARGAGPLFTGDPRVGPELRLILGAEDEVHTWLGIFGKPGASAVGRGERAALTALAPRLLAELERTRAPTADVHGAIALDAEGQIIAADARAGPWLEAEGRRRRLPTLLRVGRAGDAVEGPLDGARLRLRAARGRLGPIWLGSISSPAPLERALDALLTRTQREVASYAAVGATCAEIASTLGTRVETVRTHVRDIYARLGISTRAELARRWAPLMDDEGAPPSLAS